jgi:hypothetical protein
LIETGVISNGNGIGMGSVAQIVVMNKQNVMSKIVMGKNLVILVEKTLQILI